jgi:hypothetical protein
MIRKEEDKKGRKGKEWKRKRGEMVKEEKKKMEEGWRREVR